MKMGLGGVPGHGPKALVAAGLSKQCSTIFSLCLGILISGKIASNYGVQDCILPSHPYPTRGRSSALSGSSFQVPLKPDRDSQLSRYSILELALISTAIQVLCSQQRAVFESSPHQAASGACWHPAQSTGMIFVVVFKTMLKKKTHNSILAARVVG